jgi:Cdc6-like AAA superfamily ATPase
LSAPDPSENLFKALRLREPNTGLWLLESNFYRRWKTESSFAWLHGIPGCGKTVLSTTVLENIREHTTDDPGKATAYFYFDFNEQKKQDPEMMVRSLLSQLLQQYIEVLPSIDALFASSQHGKPPPPFEKLMKVLQELIDKFPTTYLILDALDECENRRELMAIIKTMATWNVQGLHVLITSRRVGDITSTLESVLDAQSIMSIQTQAVDYDIRLYVHQRIADEASLQKWSADHKQLMEKSLAEGACGM